MLVWMKMLIVTIQLEVIKNGRFEKKTKNNL
jgi:hypothetical protein